MIAKGIFYSLVAVLLLAACTVPTEIQPTIVTEAPVSQLPLRGTSEPYPSPFVISTDNSPYPLAGTQFPTLPSYPPSPTDMLSPSGIPLTGYEPQGSDSKLQRGTVLLEITDSSILVSESFPVQVRVVLNGNLPDPCHQLRVMVSLPNEKNEINLDVYSVFDPGIMCVAIIKPFSATIPLGTFPIGHYSVLANGELIGEFNI